MKGAHAAAAVIAAAMFSYGSASAQFADNFDGPAVDQGWTFFAGDGVAAMQFVQRDGYASILIDSTRDKRGIWRALIKRNVAGALDLSLLEKPRFAMRVEARIRVCDAPRRGKSFVEHAAHHRFSQKPDGIRYSGLRGLAHLRFWASVDFAT
jgi:hypothetical protein